MTDTKYKGIHQRALVIPLVFIVLIIFSGCASKGLITEKYPEDKYPNLYVKSKPFPDNPLRDNPTFIIYGDSKPGWRLTKFRDSTWIWKFLKNPAYFLDAVRDGVAWLRKTPNYGIKERLMVRNAIYKEAKKLEVDFIIHNGDMISDGRYPSHWKKFLEENKIDLPLLVDFPVLPVVGNHERVNDQEKDNDPHYGYKNYKTVFNYPQFYVVEALDAAIFVLDSNVILDKELLLNPKKQEALFQEWIISENPDEPAWLERKLKASDHKFKIIAMHHPPVSFGRHRNDWKQTGYGQNLTYKREQLLNLFFDNGVQLVFACHEHSYEHSIVRRLSGGELLEGTIHVVITGGGGASLRKTTDAEALEEHLEYYREAGDGLDIWVRQKRIHHYCTVKISPDEISIDVMNVRRNTEDPELAEKIVIR